MIKYSVCLDAVFSGMDILDSIRKTHDCGINTIEFWGFADKDIDSIAALTKELDMTVSTFCAPPVGLNDCAKHDLFSEGLNEAIIAAKKLNVDRLITLVGQDTGEPTEVQHANIIEGLKKALPLLEANDVTIMIEPLNVLVDHIGYSLYYSNDAFDIVDKVGSKYVKVIFDIYHQQITEGNLISSITSNIDKIAHFHTAGNPGRHELDTGEINYNEVIKAIDKTNYTGCIGLEYFPVGNAETSLKNLPFLK